MAALAPTPKNGPERTRSATERKKKPQLTVQTWLATFDAWRQAWQAAGRPDVEQGAHGPKFVSDPAGSSLVCPGKSTRCETAPAWHPWSSAPRSRCAGAHSCRQATPPHKVGTSGSHGPPSDPVGPSRSRPSSSPHQLVVTFIGEFGPDGCVGTQLCQTSCVLGPAFARVAANGSNFDHAFSHLQVNRAFKSQLRQDGLGYQHALRIPHSSDRYFQGGLHRSLLAQW